MLKHASAPVSVMILYDSREKLPGADWSRKLKGFGFDFELRHQMVDVTAFRHCKDFFNSYTNYLRVYAPDYAESDRIIYSDVDVVFTADIADLHSLNIGRAMIALPGGVACGTRGEKEKPALRAYGKNDKDLYFGSGLAVINVAAYLQAAKLQACKDVASRFGPSLIYHEQTIWNCVFHSNEIFRLDEMWCQSPPLKKSETCKPFLPGIVHYAGSPKPWDLLGEYFHHSYKIWRDAAISAGMKNQTVTKYFDVCTLQRAVRIKNQYRVWLQ